MHPITIPTPFPVGPVNCYLAEGDPLTLIDTGPKDPATDAALRHALSTRGLSYKDIRRIVVTHAHVDHFGLAAEIVGESGAQVLSHSRNLWWLVDSDGEWERRYEFYRDVFVHSGAPSAYADSAAVGMRQLSQYGASIPPDAFVPLEDGAVIRLGPDPWRVIFAPGHASGLICLYEDQSRTLISSDHLLRDITSNPVLEPPNRGETERPRALLDYMTSMEMTERMDIHTALPAHGQPIVDMRALVDERLAFHRSRLDRIESLLECCAETPYEICNLLFPGLKSLDTFLGLSEVIGHLDILEAEGRVRLETRDGLWRYIPTRGDQTR